MILLGYSGYTINEISSAADHAITTYKPNIILLHAGTNDLDRGGKEKDPIPGAPDRLGQLIDKCVSSNPDAAILVAQIINAEDGLTESNIQTFNKAIPGLVKQRADQGHHVSVVDMTSITTGDLSDGLHPSDAGYRKSKSSSVGRDVCHEIIESNQTMAHCPWPNRIESHTALTTQPSSGECLAGCYQGHSF